MNREYVTLGLVEILRFYAVGTIKKEVSEYSKTNKKYPKIQSSHREEHYGKGIELQ
jgi:hypothetical protein